MVIVQHGILESAASWVLNGKDSFGFRLVDAGFDVWLNSQRGSIYSREHEYLDIGNKNTHAKHIKDQVDKYWYFTFNEIGKYEYPALCKFVMEVTGQSKLSFIANSMGFTSLYVSLIYYPDFWRQHLKICVGIAPVTVPSTNQLLKMIQDKQFIARFTKN